MGAPGRRIVVLGVAGRVLGLKRRLGPFAYALLVDPPLPPPTHPIWQLLQRRKRFREIAKVSLERHRTLGFCVHHNRARLCPIFRTRPRSQPAWECTSTLPSSTLRIDTFCSLSSSRVGQRASSRCSLAPPRTMAIVSASTASPAAVRHVTRPPFNSRGRCRLAGERRSALRRCGRARSTGMRRPISDVDRTRGPILFRAHTSRSARA